MIDYQGVRSPRGRSEFFRPRIRSVGLLVSFLTVFVRCLPGESHLEHPAAIVLSGVGPTAGTEHSGSRVIETGDLLFSGETVRAESTMTIAFCRAEKQDGLQLRLPAGGDFTITSLGVDARQGSTAFLSIIPVCVLPLIDRTNQAENADGPPDDSLHPADVAARLARASSALAPQFDAATSLAADPALRLVGLVSQAATLEQADLHREALILYRAIRKEFKGALWTRSVISRIDQALLFAPKALAPDLTARVRPAGAGGTVDAPPDFSKGQTFALLVGLSIYPEGKGPNLKYADSDAMTVAAFLKSEQGGNVPPENIELLTNEAATRDAFEGSLTRLLKAGVGSRNTLLIFVAGHGTYSCSDKEQDIRSGMSASASPDKDCPEGMVPFIVMRNGDREAPNITGYSMERLRELVTSHASSFGRVLVFIDVCHGGNTTWNVDVRPPLRNLELITSLRAKGGLLGILTGSEVASRGNEAKEYAYESAKLKHGVFTFYLLKGLSGAAPVVGGTIPILQLSSYVRSSVQQFTNLKTSPGEYWTDGSMPLVGNPNAKNKADLNLVDAPEIASLIMRGGPPINDFGLSEALQSDDLLDTNPKIRDALAAVRANYTETSPQFALAMGRYRIALEDKGQEVIARYLRGDQDPVPQGDFDRCAKLFDAAYSIAADAAFDESRALFCRGRQLMFSKSARDFESALKLLQSSIAIDSGRSYAYNALGISLLERANQDSALLPRAVEAFLEAIRFEPKWAYPRHNLALALSESGRYTEAIQAYRDAMVVGPQYSYLPYNLGLLYQSIGNVDEAKSAYKVALRVAEKRCGLRSLSPTDPCPERALPQAGLASIFAQNASPKKGEELYHQALHDAPSDMVIGHDLASLYAGWKGHQAFAEKIWTDNLRTNPHDVPSLVGYTGLLKHQCRFAVAIPWLRNLTAEAPKYEPAWLDLAIAEAHSGSAKNAQVALLAVQSHSAEYWAAKAETSEALGDPAAAEGEWLEALDKARDQPVRKSIQRRQSKAVSCAF